MKNILNIIVVGLMVCVVSSATAANLGAKNKRFGLGVNIGEPLGLNARYYFIDRLSFDFVTGYGFGEEGYILQPSLLVNLRRLIDYDGKDWSFVPYFGAGVKTGVDVGGRNKDRGIFAMRFPIGANFILKKGLLEISAEFAPGAEFKPDTEFDPTGGIGIRYYFF
ncbi:MAG: hypothetical protein HY540_07725 [Deltaproteobacteria bacterium]|nr:hypothetical protein [Deltaproteobacteria bacterium]